MPKPLGISQIASDPNNRIEAGTAAISKVRRRRKRNSFRIRRAHAFYQSPVTTVWVANSRSRLLLHPKLAVHLGVYVLLLACQYCIRNLVQLVSALKAASAPQELSSARFLHKSTWWAAIPEYCELLKMAAHHTIMCIFCSLDNFDIGCVFRNLLVHWRECFAFAIVYRL